MTVKELIEQLQQLNCPNATVTIDDCLTGLSGISSVHPEITTIQSFKEVGRNKNGVMEYKPCEYIEMAVIITVD